MTVPFQDLAAPHSDLETELVAAMTRVLRSGRYVLAEHTARLESALAAQVGATHAVAVSSGTDALVAAMMAAGVRPGDRVLTTAYSFVASATAIARLGARPELIDIDRDSFNLSPAAVDAWFQTHAHAAHTVKAILPVHLFGQCADLPALKRTADAQGVRLIEDCAQAWGATLPSSQGVLRAGGVGHAATVSFYPTKNLGAIGEAGAVLTSSYDLAARLRQVRNQGAERPGVYEALGGNFRMDELQAALLMVKLPHLPAWTERRRILAARYEAALSGEDGIALPPAVWGSQHHVYHQYVVRVPDRREHIRARLATQGIETRVYYPLALHHQPCFSWLAISPQDFPAARQAADENLALPIHPHLSEAQQDRVIEVLRSELRS